MISAIIFAIVEKIIVFNLGSIYMLGNLMKKLGKNLSNISFWNNNVEFDSDKWSIQIACKGV